jgi:hypothetical protein
MYDTIQKTLIAWAFNHYIAYYYFDNVNVTQLKVAFEKGEIELENLPVKRDALKHLKLPWNVVSGTVGKLSIRIPLLTLLTEPWFIKINNLTLIVSPRGHESKQLESSRQRHDSENANENGVAADLSQIEINESSSVDNLENSNLEDSEKCGEQSIITSSEETKLAEFYASFSATVSSIVKDVYKNIRLEIESMTLLFEDFKHGLVKFNADNLLLHRPGSERKLTIENVSFYLSSIGSHTWPRREDLLKINLFSCNLELCDVSNSKNQTSLEINSETDIKGTLSIVGPSTSSIPVCKFLLEDFRMLYYSADQQQDGSIFARISCSHFNRERTSWDPLLKPWPFNLSWDKRKNHRRFSLTSDETTDLNISSALLDLIDVVRRRIFSNSMQSKLWPVITTPSSPSQIVTQENDSLFVLQNDTGHRIFYAPLDNTSESFNSCERSKSVSPAMSTSGDAHTLRHKVSVSSRSSTEDNYLSDFHQLTRWQFIETDKSVHLEPAKSMLIRVEGWKTLLPIPLDRTGQFFRKAWSDRVKNEDTYIVVSVDLEDKTARKIISVRSPLNLVNLLDATLEVHFADVDQALYIKPEGHLPVPLPYLFSRMHVRPCNVGVTMSEKPLIWDDMSEVDSTESKIHICYPITMTNKKHASYCTSQAYRVCASLQKETSKNDSTQGNGGSLPVYSLSFLPPLTIVNLLPCELKYYIGDVPGSLSKGSEQKIHHVDLTKPTEVHFEMNGFPRSRAITIDPGTTGSFQYTLEMFDKNNRSLYLNAKIILASFGEEPAVQIIIYAPFWFINKTKLPLIFKQEGAALEAAGQYREHEDRPNSILLFSFYDTELEPPWLCSMRLGKSKGVSMWCDGFKLDKGSGQRRISFIPKTGDGDSKMNRSIIDINIRRGYGRYSETFVITLTTCYGFDTLAKTPKKTYNSSPQDCKLIYYNYNTNLAQQIAGRSTRQLFTNHSRNGISEMNFVGPGFRLTLVDCRHEKIIEISFENVVAKSTTKVKENIIDCSIQDIRIENALPDCDKTIVLDRASNLNQSLTTNPPALRLIMDRIIGKSFGTVWFRQVQISMCELVMNIEEKLFLKLVEFISFRKNNKSKSTKDLSRDLDKILHPETDRLSKYYFDMLRIDLSSLKMSCYTASNLPESLQRIKSYLGLKFFSFEDARVQLSPFLKMNVSRTLGGIFDSVSRFYKRQISEQAPRIVGQQIQNYLRFHLSDLLSSIYDEVYNKLFY